MAKRKRKRTASERVKRLSFPHDEKRHSWLRILLDAYFIIDRGVAAAIESEQDKGRRPACRKGCSACCSTHKDIPVYPLELRGITWYVTEKTAGAAREMLRKQLSGFSRNSPCPFLLEGACSIHPIRPMACRQFNVFGVPCREGEDPYYTRRGDVMDPVKKHVDQAFFIMLPFHGVDKETERIKIVETGAFHKMVRELHSCDWKRLAREMEIFERRNQGEGAQVT